MLYSSDDGLEDEESDDVADTSDTLYIPNENDFVLVENGIEDVVDVINSSHPENAVNLSFLDGSLSALSPFTSTLEASPQAITTTTTTSTPLVCLSKANSNSVTYTENRKKPRKLFGNINIDPKSSEFQRITWRQKNLLLNPEDIEFRGDTLLSEEILSLDTPYQCFRYMFPVGLESKIVQQSILYAVQKGDHSFKFNEKDLQRFLGIIYTMSVTKLPSIRDYWGKYGVELISNQMSLNRFKKICQYIHFNDKTKAPNRDDQNRDRLYGIRPLVDTFNQRFGTVPKLAYLSVDEQMCSTKMGHFLKQYMPNKPCKWGFKLFALCDTKGFSYKFEIYDGPVTTDLRNEPDLGASANIVVRLTREVERNKNYIIYFDNYFSTVPLVVHLYKQGILSVGTIRRNRIKNCKLPDEKAMMKHARGASQEFVANISGVDVVTLSWKDNRIVNLISTYVGMKSFIPGENPNAGVATRFDKKTKQVITIPCPQIIKEYNRNMGGVDLMDSFMGRHKVTIKTRKWTNRIFYHLLDMVMVNSWVLYKRAHPDRADCQSMKQADFRRNIAATLFNINSTTEPGNYC